MLFSTAYLPPVSYFVGINMCEEIVLESCENYTKQTYRNRCNIVSANGVVGLTIPVEKGYGNKIPIQDVRISDYDNWQKIHWKSICSAYRSSPFFDFYEDDFRPFYHKKWKYLWDYNLELLNLVLELLDIQPKITFTNDFQVEYKDKMDYRFTINPKKESVVDIQPYYQVFQAKHGFIKDMSIIDLLFNMGNESIFTIQDKQFNY